MAETTKDQEKKDKLMWGKIFVYRELQGFMILIHIIRLFPCRSMNFSYISLICSFWGEENSSSHIRFSITLKTDKMQLFISSINSFIAWRSIESEREVTAMGLFTVNKSTMLTAYSTILGYLIILVQFDQTTEDSVEPMIQHQKEELEV